MKLLVIGVGECGNRIAAEFARLDERAHRERGARIVVSAYAVNDNQDFLKELSRSKPRGLTTIPVRTASGTVLATSESGAQIMREEGGRVLTAVKPNEFYDTDAILFVSGAAGILGAGGVPIMAQNLKERHIGKPIYALVTLPFESEANDPHRIRNTAISLKAIHQVTDAVFLFENERFKMKQSDSVLNGVDDINRDMVSYFYDLLCATGEVGARHTGAKSIGVGDIDQTLIGWTALGIGTTTFPMSRSFLKKEQTFLEKGSETIKIMEAMTSALSRLSASCKLEDATKALYLLSIPAGGVSVDMAKVLGNHLRELTHDAEIRGGDFYGTKDVARVTLIVSGLNYVDSVKSYYEKAASAARTKAQEKTPAE